MREPEIRRGDRPITDTSAFALAARRRGGITTGRYGSNSGPRAWQIFAQEATRYELRRVSSGSMGLSIFDVVTPSYRQREGIRLTLNLHEKFTQLARILTENIPPNGNCWSDFQGAGRDRKTGQGSPTNPAHSIAFNRSLWYSDPFAFCNTLKS